MSFSPKESPSCEFQSIDDQRCMHASSKAVVSPRSSNSLGPDCGLHGVKRSEPRVPGRFRGRFRTTGSGAGSEPRSEPRVPGSSGVPGQVLNDRFRAGSEPRSEPWVPRRFRGQVPIHEFREVSGAGSEPRVSGQVIGLPFGDTNNGYFFFPIRVNFPRLRGHSFTATTSPLLSVISSV